MDLSRSRTTEPIIKGKNYKARESKRVIQKVTSPDSDKGKIRRESSKLDKGYE